MLRVAEHAERTDTGRQRKGNEDAYFARSPLFAVADGMGGAQAGEVASRAAIEAIEHGLPDGPGSAEERLAGLVLDANERIIELARADRERAGMGTTHDRRLRGRGRHRGRARRRLARCTACAAASSSC